MSIQDMMDTYRRVNASPSTFTPIQIHDHTPTVESQDKVRGSLTRYFTRPVQQTSHTDIQEIDQRTYTKPRTNKLYTVVAVRWQISGPLIDEYSLTESETPVRLRSGVISGNQRSIELASETLVGLSQAVTNYSRFYQGL